MITKKAFINLNNVAVGASAVALIVSGFLFAAPLAAQAVVGGPACSVPSDYATIQGAINDAGCSTITVAAGTYTEHVSINRAVILNGANAGIAGNGVRGAESIVDGTDTDAPFAITANNVTINGFTVKNGSNGGLFSGIWSQTGTQNSNILNNIITQNGFGVWAQCGGNCLIQANLFDGNNKANSPGSGGISADSTTGLTINNNEFKNHTAGNPILLQGVSPASHNNIVVTNNNFHDNSGASVIYALAITGGTFTGNTILVAFDVTGISFSGADTNITVTNNIITGAARGVRVEDAGYYGSSGGNSNIVVNRNSLASDSEYGAGNLGGYTGNVDATCNWWGSASGPGLVATGSGSPVTTNVSFLPWLTSSDLSGACNGGLLKVHILKYLDGSTATAISANSYQFPMSSTWSAANIGAGTGTYVLGTNFGGAADLYGADTSFMSAPADYTTSEITDNTSQVVASPELCQAGKYLLNGYRASAISFADAATQPLALVAPAFTGLQSDEYVIVDNSTCATTGSLTVEKDAIGGNGTFNFTSDIPGHTAFSITTTTGVGSQTFTGITPGTYHVTEATQTGWTQTDSECSVSGIAVSAGGAPICVITNTKNARLGEIRGAKIEDRDGDGKLKDGDHHRLSGWTIYLDTNNNDALNSGEPSTITDSHGQYRFLSLPAGTYHVREVGKSGWLQTYPSSGKYDINLAAGQIAKKKDFGNFHLGTISGMKYNDLNSNGKKDANEVGLAGWTIKLKGPGFNGPTVSTVTDANGNYSFTGLTAGTYTLSEVSQSGWHQTQHPSSVKIQSGTTSTRNNFGNHFGPIVRGGHDEHDDNHGHFGFHGFGNH